MGCRIYSKDPVSHPQRTLCQNHHLTDERKPSACIRRKGKCLEEKKTVHEAEKSCWMGKVTQGQGRREA